MPIPILSSVQAALEGAALQVPMQKFAYRTARAILRQAIKDRLIQPGAIHRLCDFGAGFGGSTLALAQHFPKAHWMAMEQNARQAQAIRQVLVACDVVNGDGLLALGQQANRLDLLTAFMLGPDYHNEGFVQSFLQLGIAALAPAGTMLVCSDTATMHVVQETFSAVLAGSSALQISWLSSSLESPELRPPTLAIRKLPSTVPLVACESDIGAVVNASFPRYPLAEPAFYTLSNEQDLEPSESDSHDERSDAEVWCIATPFEWQALLATYKTYKAISPEHLAISSMHQLLYKTSASLGGHHRDVIKGLED